MKKQVPEIFNGRAFAPNTAGVQDWRSAASALLRPPDAVAGEKLDPRAAIAGASSGGSSQGWRSGMFDRGTWTECQANWARSVVTGRARLGGVPVGKAMIHMGPAVSVTP